MDHRRWLVLVILSVVAIFQIDSLFGKSNSRFIDRDRTYRREISLQTGLVRIQSWNVIRANPDFDLKFHYRPVIKFNYLWQFSEHWWGGTYISYGEIGTNLFIKEAYLPEYHTRLGIKARGNYVEGGSCFLYRWTILTKWIVQGKLGFGVFLEPGKGHYEWVQEGIRTNLTSYAEIRDVSDEIMERNSFTAYAEVQAGRNFGRHSLCLSVAYQRFGSSVKLPKANFFQKKYEFHSWNNKVHYANLTNEVADACRFELVYSFRY